MWWGGKKAHVSKENDKTQLAAIIFYNEKNMNAFFCLFFCIIPPILFCSP